MDIDVVTRRVREEFREMPGLRLTPAQATRLWGLEQDVCRQDPFECLKASFEFLKDRL